MKLLYAMAFALFPLTVSAQSPDTLLLTALCNEDYFEDTAGQCKSLTAKEDLTFEAILTQYGEIISSDAHDESVFYLTEEVPVGAIRPQQSAPSDNAIVRQDDDRTADIPNEENTVAAQIVTIESPGEKAADAEGVATNCPIPAGVAANTSMLTDQDRTVAREDEDRTADLMNKENTIAARIIRTESSESSHEKSADADEVATNDPTPDVAASTSILTDEDRMVE